MSSPYELAKESDYNDEEIQEYFSKKDPNFSTKYKQAIEQGYEPREVYEFLSKSKSNGTGKENIIDNIDRQISRSGARIAETALGAPRAVGDFLQSLVPEQALIKGAEKLGIGEFAKKSLETQKKYSAHKLLPSSDQIRNNVTKYLFGEKLEPKNIWEKRADDVISDFTALALPLPGSQLKVLRPALTSLGANIASETIGQMGGSEKQKTFAKLGSFLVGSLANPKGAEKLANNLYKQAESVLPKDATVSSTNLGRSLDELEASFRKGGLAGSDKVALEKIADLRNEMQGAQIPVDSLVSAKRKINEARAGLFKALEGNKPGIKTAKFKLDKVSKAVDSSLEEYGKHNPEWQAFYKPANEVFGAIAQSKKARNWLINHKKNFGTFGALSLFGIEQAIGLPTSAAAVGIGGTAGLTAEFMTRLAKSPTLRKYYTNVINAALKQDVIAAQENLKKLDEEMKK